MHKHKLQVPQHTKSKSKRRESLSVSYQTQHVPVCDAYSRWGWEKNYEKYNGEMNRKAAHNVSHSSINDAMLLNIYIATKNTKTAIYPNNRNTNGCTYYELTSIGQLGKKTTGN